jgi:glucose/arabinose dehydrogenase
LGGVRLPVRLVAPAAAAGLALWLLLGGIGGGSSEEGPPAQAAEFVDFATVRQPVHVASPPGDPSRIFIVQQRGLIRVTDDGRLLRPPFLDISADVRHDGLYGLLSMAFAPDYSESGRFYVFYTDRRNRTRIEEFRRSRDPNRALVSSRRRVVTLELPAPFDHGTHIGGQLAFGPDDFLYISTGDGSRGYVGEEVLDTAQRLDTLLGKLLRIDPVARGRPYGVPKDNPFVARRGRDEIYAYGLRNPWRFSFDRGRIALADPGQFDREEVNILPLPHARAANFGWPTFEGSLRQRRGPRRGLTFPAFEYEPRADAAPGQGCAGAVIGGFFARDESVPSLFGRYVYADYCLGEVRSFDPRDPDGTDRLEFDSLADGRQLLPNSLGVDSTGRILVVFRQLADGEGSVLQVVE